jgi:hypothetical protein
LLSKKKKEKNVKKQDQKLNKKLEKKNKLHVNKEEKQFFKMLKKH